MNVSLMLAHLRTYPTGFYYILSIQSEKVERINYVLTLAEKLWSGHGRTSRTGSGAYALSACSSRLLVGFSEAFQRRSISQFFRKWVGQLIQVIKLASHPDQYR